MDVEELKMLKSASRVMPKAFPSRPGLRLRKELKSELRGEAARSPEM